MFMGIWPRGSFRHSIFKESNRDVVVLGAARSAIGTFGGSLADTEQAELAGSVMKEAVVRSGADPTAINYVTVGTTIPADSRFAYVARRTFHHSVS
ncbi:hypothetical protein PQR70_19580 [Paraburkholderia madseniana]|uniref:thiolase family protein n=1 Tax=Paraburkholderia madseniana TaxID=2599607 RepID=UPI0038BA290B